MSLVFILLDFIKINYFIDVEMIKNFTAITVIKDNYENTWIVQ